MNKNEKLQLAILSPLGPLYLIASASGLEGVYTSKRKMIPMTQPHSANGPQTVKTVEHLTKAQRQLSEYFSGERQNFDLKLNLEGTDFQKRVWNELSRIPYGKKCSYKDIAKRIAKPLATRAVGNANGKNPLCIIIPCHRVIAANGTIGGYTGGLPMKKYLLTLESQNSANAREAFG